MMVIPPWTATSLSSTTTSANRPRILLSPSSQILLTQVAGVKRGPKRFLGKTRSQVLDFFMRTNVRICATISALFFPIVAFYVFRYNYVLKPRKLQLKKEAEEKLLAEGKYVEN